MGRVISIAATVGCLAFGVGPASGHARGVILYGAGTAAVDGTLSPAEWVGARQLDFGANQPAHDGGGTIPATIRAMNDGSTLYVSLEVARATYGGGTSLALYFDNNHDGMREAGDDAFLADVGTFSAVRFLDWHWAPCVPGGPGIACPVFDTERGGTTDGMAAASITSGHAVIEAAHPLDSADDAHDFSLGAGSVVGFAALIRIWSSDTACNDGPACYADTVVPIGLASHGDTNGYGDLVVSPDTVPPETTLTGGPDEGSLTGSGDAAFTLAGTDNLTPADQLGFTCSVDGRPFADCVPQLTLSQLGDGEHRVEARASDELGNVDATPAIRNWRVDVTPPSRARVRVRVKGRRASVHLAAGDAMSGIASYRCALDRARYKACHASFLLRAKPGRHVLRAFAVDRAGHSGAVGSARFRVRAKHR